MTESEQPGINIFLRNERRLKDMWDYKKSSNTCIISIVKREKKEDGAVKGLKVKMVENFPKLAKDVNLVIQGADKILKRKIQRNLHQNTS